MPVSKFGEDLTQDRLKYFLDYDRSTGIFRWKFNRKGLFAGSVAGHKAKSGYVCIRLDKRLYRAHRLAWPYVFGEWPADCIDHKNHDRSDNRIDNLRESTKPDNQKNLSMNVKNSSGVMGVSWYAASGKWAAEICHKKKKYFLGYFDTLEAAAKTRQEAEERFSFAAEHGK